MKVPPQMPKHVISNVLRWMEAGLRGFRGLHAIRIAFSFDDVNVLILLQNTEGGIVKAGQTRI